jgi:hypothetical protein
MEQSVTLNVGLALLNGSSFLHGCPTGRPAGGAFLDLRDAGEHRASDARADMEEVYTSSPPACSAISRFIRSSGTWTRACR